jgi:adenine-specific DNA methylase
LAPDISIWARGQIQQNLVKEIWERCVCEEASPRDVDVLTLPKIYGNKHRLTAFIAGVLRSHLADGGFLLDLMSGTGIVASRLSAYFKIFANDANPFAALLTRAQFLALDSESFTAAIDRLEPLYQRNVQALSGVVLGPLNEERMFMHCNLTEKILSDYKAFCSSFPLQNAELQALAMNRSANPHTEPYCLTSAYFANAYFGVEQSLQIDSIRYAISQLPDERVKTFLLAALLVACSTCASGPHFAQPPKLNRPVAAREVIEHRSRDLFSEFRMTARFMLSRTPHESQLIAATAHDWRNALSEFVSVTTSDRRATAVYVDPPYTKMQFSRYYHVLNTLISYEYPGFQGEGRYPPRSARFSSRFEYQPGPAEREFEQLTRACADQHLTTVISYSNRGLVSFDKIIRTMETRYPTVELYAKEFRHASQGRPFQEGRQNVQEYLLVGTFN